MRISDWSSDVCSSDLRNAGPAIRLNQGAAAACGRYLCLVDADELIAPDAVAVMRTLMERAGAQMAHGKIAASSQPAATLIPPPVGNDPDFAVLNAPLEIGRSTRLNSSH